VEEKFCGKDQNINNAMSSQSVNGKVTLESYSSCHIELSKLRDLMFFDSSLVSLVYTHPHDNIMVIMTTI
jgi:hypothetical protein